MDNRSTLYAFMYLTIHLIDTKTISIYKPYTKMKT